MGAWTEGENAERRRWRRFRVLVVFCGMAAGLLGWGDC
jgi:hypothetical protein